MEFEMTLFIVIYQSACLFLFILTIQYIYQKKSFYMEHKSILNRGILGIFVGIFLTLMYVLNISNILALFMIILPFTMMYLGFGTTLYIYFIISTGNMLFMHAKIRLLILYLGMILISKLVMILKKNYLRQLVFVYILSSIFLNFELFSFSSKLWEYLVYNIVSLIIWFKLLFLIYKFHEKKIRYIKNKKITYVDKITNVNNYFCLLNNSKKILENKTNQISLILFNVDRLKDINLLYGSQCGDKVIKIVSDIIKKNVSLYGVVYRLDGDTFCVVAVKEKFSIMQTISEKIRMEIDKKVIIVDNNKINISVSAGGYHGEITSEKIDDYIELAQQSLFCSKYHGRNRVMLNNQMVYYPKVI